jgi:O-antigen ligase
MFGLRAYSSAGIALAVVVAAIAGVLLGALQVTSPDPATSSWYLFPQTNFGVAVGFFANANHMASLLLIAIPMVVALIAYTRNNGEDVRLRFAAMVVGSGSLVLLLIGLALNGSLAGYGLALPVLLASLLMLVGPRHRRARLAILAGGLACFLAFLVLIFTPLNRYFIPEDSTTSVSSRAEMLEKSFEAIGEFGMAGSGIGSFQKVYSLFEDPTKVNLTYVNHAHNDYVEIAVEAGLPGAIVLLLFLGWWALAVGSMVRSPASDHYAVAGAIGSAAVLIHSTVEFPLRIAAISASFAACLALLVLSRRHARGEKDLRPTRHVVIG